MRQRLITKANAHQEEYKLRDMFRTFDKDKSGSLSINELAGLLSELGVAVNDNELVLLESIHLFVEVLDHFFSNVCELDLVFNFHKVYLIIDEFVLAGEIQETSKKQILERLAELERNKE